MNCRGVSRRLSAYIDGQLSPAIRESVEDHLKGCLLCRRKLAEFEAIVRVAHELPSVGVSDGFADRVLAAAKTEFMKKEAFGKISYRFGLASAAFITVAAAIFLIFGPANNMENITQSDVDIKQVLDPPGEAEIQDISSDPRAIVYTVPVPEDILARDRMLDDSLLLADTSSKIDQFVLPEVDRGLKVNKEF
ncbi:MAG: zf-HC2 domain-containing protein [Candidatus Zixiibacteriota bacterium]|nr:MAG: zf-HC2 domain-containing protein [candidate division Zixibacteria bacterium]